MSHETDTLVDRLRLCKGLESCIRPVGLMLIIYSAVPRAIVCLARNLISDTSHSGSTSALRLFGGLFRPTVMQCYS